MGPRSTAEGCPQGCSAERRRSSQFLRRFLQHVLPGGFMRIRHCGFYAPAAQARYQRLCAFLAHVNAPAEPWTPTCEKCGGRVFILSIRVGRRTLIPQATIDHFGIGGLPEARAPARPP